jgi:tetratricopeptide (TPR) repeat protein/predicted Ser/Thr protein kinase
MKLATGSDLGEAPTERASTADEPPAATADPPGTMADPASATADPMAGLQPSAPAGELLARAQVFGGLFGEDSTLGRFGRFRVLGRLGKGAFGVVHEAYDPNLARGVALKVVEVQDKDSKTALAEAQALAKLSHPNVVPIYDVGVERNHVFLFMELVLGDTLRTWAEGRGARDILAVYQQAGAGLAAAHAAGLVHRDFKPDNAIVGRDGRVRVVDFGLACEAEDPARAGGERRAAAGTPFFMAPEIKAGAAVTPAADQYSFCVALADALSRASPPAGRWIAAVLERGRAAVPTERFASMTELLHALARDPATVWRRRAAVAGLVVVVGVAAYPRAPRDSAPDPCEFGSARLDEVWRPDVRAAGLSRVASLGAYGASLRPVLERGLDAHRQRWIAAYRTACVDQRSGIESSAQVDRRNICLARGPDGLAAVRDLVARIGQGELEQLPRAVQSLPDPAECSDRSTLQSDVAPPPPARKDAVAQIRRQIAQARIGVGAGRYADALMNARVAAYDAHELDYPPVLAEALLVQGHARMLLADRKEAVPLLERATQLALASHDDALAVEAWARRAWAQGTSTPSDPEHALAGLDVIDAIAQRTPSAAFARALLYNNAGSVELGRGRRDQARDDFQRAMTASREVVGSLELQAIRINLALLSDAAQGDELIVEVAAERSHRLGPDHPDTLAIQWSRATSTIHNLSVAAEVLTPTCQGYERHPTLAAITVQCWTELGRLRWDLGDREQAIAAMERAVATQADSAEAAAWLLLLRDDPRAAVARFGEALAARPARASDPSWRQLLRFSLLAGLGFARGAAGDLEGARDALQQAIEGLDDFTRTYTAAICDRELGRARVALAFVLSEIDAPAATRRAAATKAVAWLEGVGGSARAIAELTKVRNSAR